MARIADAAERLTEMATAERERERRERDRVEAGLRPLRALDPRPRRMNFVPYAEAIRGLIQQFRMIPVEAWTQAGEREVEVSCPCGRTPLLERMIPTFCGEVDGEGIAAEGECPRAFLYDGQSVRVAFSPVK